jgi:hypothetical protein
MRSFFIGDQASLPCAPQVKPTVADLPWFGAGHRDAEDGGADAQEVSGKPTPDRGGRDADLDVGVAGRRSGLRIDQSPFCERKDGRFRLCSSPGHGDQLARWINAPSNNY